MTDKDWLARFDQMESTFQQLLAAYSDLGEKYTKLLELYAERQGLAIDEVRQMLK